MSTVEKLELELSEYADKDVLTLEEWNSWLAIVEANPCFAGELFVQDTASKGPKAFGDALGEGFWACLPPPWKAWVLSCLGSHLEPPDALPEDGGMYVEGWTQTQAQDFNNWVFDNWPWECVVAQIRKDIADNE